MAEIGFYPQYIMDFHPRISELVDDMDFGRYTRVRRQLAKLVNRVPDKWKPLVALAIREVKLRAYAETGSFHFEPPDAHALSDHALVRAFQRVYGIDILKLKDYVLNDVMQKRTFELVHSDDAEKIVTVLKTFTPNERK